jgi:methionine-rich copper-binding protein CopC
MASRNPNGLLGENKGGAPKPKSCCTHQPQRAQTRPSFSTFLIAAATRQRPRAQATDHCPTYFRLADRFKSAARACTGLFVALLLINPSVSNSQNLVPKKGGVYFRVDDNHSASQWTQYAAIFDRYNLKTGIAINITGVWSDPSAISALRAIRNQGHEITDHTPDHATHYFSGVTDASSYLGRPGVDHISGNTVYLKYGSIDTSTYPGSGFANIYNNLVVSTQAGEFSNLSGFTQIYFPSLGKLCNISSARNSNPANVDSVYVQSAWGESIDLGVYTNVAYKRCDIMGAKVTDEALNLLAERSLSLFSQAGLGRPYGWIQPGSYGPNLDRKDLKRVYGQIYEYQSGATYWDVSRKVFNEYDPDTDKRFSMMWGDFDEEHNYAKDIKSFIADRVAKHYVVCGHSHFQGGIGGWDSYLGRIDSLLSWCSQFGVPVKNQTQWAEILYGSTPDPYENIIPPLNIDLDDNGVPDGYYRTDGILDKTDGIPDASSYSYSLSTNGRFSRILSLAGIEKGDNDFIIWIKGAVGSTVRVYFSFPGNSYTQIALNYTVSSSNWKKYTLADANSSPTSVYIPPDVSVVDLEVFRSGSTAGTVKISGMEMRKAGTPDVTPPTVVTYNPANNATGVGVNQNLILTFSENVTKGTGNILIKKSLDQTPFETIDVTALAVTVSGAQVTIDPTGTFLAETGYYVEIASTCFKDASNNFFAGISGPTTWHFTTADVTPPTVLTYNPADNATGVGLSQNLVLTFSENVVKGMGNIVIKKSPDQTVFETIDVTSGAVTISAAQVTINPVGTFAGSTGYYVEIAATCFKDASNNFYVGISGATAWNFTTADVTLPTVLTYTPADNAAGVGVNQNLVMTFSENMVKAAGNILIKRSSDNAVFETIDVTTPAVTVSGTQVTIDPAGRFAGYTGYYVEIAATCFKDASNNFFAGIWGSETWNFTTIGVSEAPTVTAPIAAGATSVSGTSGEANGTTIEVFVNNASVGTTTVAGNVWTKTGLSPLRAGDQVKAKATAPGKLESAFSDEVAVIAPPDPPVAQQQPAANTGTEFTAHWSASAGATGYEIDVAILDDFTAPTLAVQDSLIPDGSATTLLVSGLSPTYTYYYRVRAVNGAGTSANSNVVTVLHITTASPLPSATKGVEYSQTLTAVGGTLPYTTWSVVSGALPPGLVLDPATGVIHGTPTDSGLASFVVQVTDNVSVAFSKTFSLNVVNTPTIAFDAVETRINGSPTSSLSWSHTIGSGTSRILIVSAGGEETGPVTNLPIADVTYAGKPLSQAVAKDVSGNEPGIGQQSDRIELWYILDKDLPAAGTYTVQVTFLAQVDAAGGASISLKNAKQGPPEATAGASTGLSDTLSTYLTVPSDNSWLISSAIVGYAGRFAPVDSQAEKFQLDLNTAVMVGSTKQVTVAGPNSMQVYHPLVHRIAQAVISLAPAPIVVRPKVFLQGPFSGGMMSNALRKTGAFADHFSGTPIPVNAVDSINIEIRDSSSAAKATVRKFAPAWLLTDGSIRGFSDTTRDYVEFAGVPIGQYAYYIVVRHRNHLAVMSATPVTLNEASALYDFTTGQSQAYTSGPKPMEDLGDGKFGMFSGDGNGTGTVTISDRIAVWRPQSGLSGYLSGDYNLSGGVTASDMVNYWRPNNGLGTQVP